MSETEKSECFVIAPIGEDKSEIRLRSDQILKHVIRPVAEECGYNAIRADDISEPGSITTQVINRILSVPMVVADLTGNNANVFYELAVRHAIRKPYVQIIRRGDRIPFDVAGIRTIEIDHTDLDSVAAAKDEMKKQMTFAVDKPDKIESPIGVAIDFASLTGSGDPLKRQLGEVLRGISEIKSALDTRLPTIKSAFDTNPSAEPMSLVDAVEQLGVEFGLTAREREILIGVAMGLTTKELAERMEINPNTIRYFMKLLKLKMGVTHQTDIIRRLTEEGSPEEEKG